MEWLLLALLAFLIWAVASIIDKVLRTKYIDNSVTLLASFGIMELAFVIGLLIYNGVPHLESQVALAAFGAGVLSAAAFLPYFKALSFEEASRVAPLFNLSPLFVLVLAVIFLDEILSLENYIAFALILMGGLLISTRRLGNSFQLSPAFGLMLLASFLFSIVDITLKYAFTNGIFLDTFIMFSIGIVIGELSLFVKTNSRKQFTQLVKRPVYLGLLFISTTTAVLAYFLFNRALTTGPVTLVTVMVGFLSIFVLIFATFLSHKYPMFLKERIDRKTLGQKLLAISLMMVGLYFIQS